jgi:hypothetical protein
MATASRKTDLSPLEAIVVERTLGDEARQSERTNTLACIQQLTKERQKLYARSATHPFAAVTNGARIRAISAQIEQLWDQLRRERAQRRTQLERALNVTPDDDEDTSAASGDGNSTDAA